MSIIVPIFNTKKYLQQCLDSILYQTYSDIQVILIDDGSTDGSNEICDIYAQRDTRITVIHQRNKGQNNARKRGLKIAKGKYIYCVDSDDWIDKEIIESVAKKIQEYGADIISVGSKREYGNDKSQIEDIPFKNGFYTKKEIEKYIIPKLIHTDNFFEWGQQLTFWQYVIRKEIFETNQMVVHDKIRIAEDVACIFPCILDAGNMYISGGKYYHYRQRQDSIKRNKLHNECESLKLVYQILVNKFLNKGKQILLKKAEYLVVFELLTFVSSNIILRKGTYPFMEFPKNSNVIVYGAGVFGNNVIDALKKYNYANIVAWVDINYKKYQLEGYSVDSPDILLRKEYDYIIVAVIRADIRKNILACLPSYNVPDEKIVDIDLNKINQTTYLEDLFSI